MISALLATCILRDSITQNAPDSSYLLRWQVKPGQVRMFKFTARGEFQKQAFETEALLSQVIQKIEPDGSFMLKSESKGMILRTAGQEVRDDDPNALVMILAADGHVIRYVSGSQVEKALRSAAFMRFVSSGKATKIGDSWIWEYKRTAGLSVPPSRTTYTLKSVSGGKAQVETNYKELAGEKPRTGHGMWTIDLADGTPMKLDAEMTNFGDAETKPTKLIIELIP